MKIYELLTEEDSGVSSGDSGSADSGTATNGGSNSAEATPSTDASTATTSGDVATVIYPLGSMITRPYFNYVRPSKKCKYGKKKDGKCKKKPG